jgi:hypothetical protein
MLNCVLFGELRACVRTPTGAGSNSLSSSSPTLVETPPEGDGWLHEIKYDGYRTELVIDRGRCRAFTRRGFDWTEKYGPIVEAAAKLPVKSAIVDGEVIVMNEAGLSDFSALRSAMRWDPGRLGLRRLRPALPRRQGSSGTAADRAPRRAGEDYRRRLRRHPVRPSHRRQRPCLL